MVMVGLPLASLIVPIAVAVAMVAPLPPVTALMVPLMVSLPSPAIASVKVTTFTVALVAPAGMVTVTAVCAV